ncbi:MAG: hypothetical protein BGO11_02425 [Solirubrobacterales bacterium 70-9]|nr:MAG: hypothetical protein BGO11_02425 [Solirubrobacterales bacterium 70-9]
MSAFSRLATAAGGRLASTEGRKRALVALVASPLIGAFALGAAVGILAGDSGTGVLVAILAALVFAVVAVFGARAILGAAVGLRRRQSTEWIPEKLRPLRVEVGAAEPRRVNILHPAIDLKHFFGGFITVFNLARELAEGGHRVRMIATEPSDLPPDWRRRLAGYEGLGDVLERIEVTFAAERPAVRFNPDDTLLATHWTVAHIAAGAAAELGPRPFVYLIQEYEPFIFPLGSAAALARGSYDLPHRAIFSTALLRDYFAAHRIGVFGADPGGEEAALIFDNAITPVGPVAAADLRAEGRRLIFYARPEEHAQRNLYELGTMALDQAAAAGTLDGWELIGVGSVEATAAVVHLPRSGAPLRMVPRSAQSEYGALLRSGDAGLALMYTPHPSLVPIEMAAAGMATVTNTYENKDAAALAAISANLIAAPPSVAGVAAGIAAAVGRVGDVEARAAGSRVAWPSRWEDVFDANFKARLDQWIAG